jgi:hypothetical protein
METAWLLPQMRVLRFAQNAKKCTKIRFDHAIQAGIQVCRSFSACPESGKVTAATIKASAF